ncbi:MAG: Glycosyl transferase family 2 [Microgenomates group bacterium GW2011_GWC1_37_8]|uniref:Glycosyl transferase family 2 n=1 Tax=Candidatus Woesebacteria bacterium GW2011_GWB1_38_8 TaxID=1618570 RepID=A0A0G0LDZ6_9BACT|nr:MAG: Glycosyl transferase family 2 [Microgenomates group bacterium GW2011_GWC1_37_8]KKQ86145.1 MAG: Glycosyl transferase family 2 [Candidatus Woesebacteria bacterium GW2011_GWB1_38_8]
MKIWVHTLVKNEERYLWFSVMSVIDWVDKILLWDTGSTDKTRDIIKTLEKKFPQKIETRFLKSVSIDDFTKVRQEMLDATSSDWFLVVDGDEIWWDDSIRKVSQKISESGNNIESIVVPSINLVGDIYHYQESIAGRYSLAGRTGHFALRGVKRKIQGLSSKNPHGTWGWTDGEGKMIQDRDKTKILFIDAPYLHATHLLRSANRELDKNVIKREKKLKYEIGNNFPKDYYYPEVFFRERPMFVPSPWVKMDNNFLLRSVIETPFRRIKRRIIKGGIGY